jgi:hypothetical protein
MLGRLFRITTTCVALIMASGTAFAQLPPSRGILPAGFRLTQERNLGSSMFINATKPNVNFPKPHMDQGISLEITWMNRPMAKRMVEMLAAQSEDPARAVPGMLTREEPCGKQRYREGVLSCRRIITPWVGGGSGQDLVTFRISWSGASPTGMVGVELNNLCGSKETAMGWIDAIIPKITKGE